MINQESTPLHTARPRHSKNHGGEVYAAARSLGIAPENILDFSSNTNIFAFHLTQKLVEKTSYPFLHYPDTRASLLVEALVQHENISPECILPGNGATELIWLFMHSMAPQKVLFIGPIFSEYVIACEALNIPYEILTPSPENEFTCSPKEYSRLWESQADLVVLCTPNNPAAVTYPDIHTLLSMIRAPRLLIDTCYREFLAGSDSYAKNHISSFAASVQQGVSLFTMNSMTNFFCCPGIRLGYLLGNRMALTRMASLRPAWTISPFAQTMGILFLKNLEEFRATIPRLNNAVTHMGRELRRLRCIHPAKVFEGTGFLCCGLQHPYKASIVQEACLKKTVLIRNCDSIPGMPQGFIRLQARQENDVHTLLTTLGNI